MIPAIPKKINEVEKRTEKKKQNQKYNKMISRLTNVMNMSWQMYTLIKDCGTFLEFISDADQEKLKMTKGNLCKHRFCPNCSYNKARKLALELSCLVEYAKDSGYELLFLTLTAPNVPGSELEDEIKEISKAFKRLTQNKDVKKAIKGYIRKLEVTYNAERNDFHPHLHVILLVNKSYFTDPDYYLSREKWLNFWRDAKRDQSITQVDIRKFKKETGNDKAIFEMSKYIAKDSNYLHSEEVFLTFYEALKGKREMSYGGFFKDARKKYSDGELDQYKTKDKTIYIYKLYFLWRQNEYKCIDQMMMTPEEIEKYNINFEDEIPID